MSNLEVPGSKLYYETEGSGPLLVLVPGGNGDGEVFKSFAEQLKPHYTVLRYDRRGFSRSELTAPQDYSVRLETGRGGHQAPHRIAERRAGDCVRH